jgi:hypothetical protein
MRKWTEEEIQKLISLYPDKENEQISIELNRTVPAIIYKAGQLNLRKSKEHISKISAAKVAKIGHFTGRKNGQACRTHFFNENYFDSIDTLEKAYWLGFIHADGSLVFDKNRNRITCLDMCVKGEDGGLVEQFVRDIDGDLTKIERRLNNSQRPMTRIRLRSPILIEALYNLGIRPRKSYKNDGALIKDKELFRHYLRGYFDGNGSVYKAREHIRMQIIGPEKLCQDFFAGIEREVGVKGGNVYPSPHSDRHILLYQTNKQCISIANWMYNGATRNLERKKNTFMSLIEGDAYDKRLS